LEQKAQLDHKVNKAFRARRASKAFKASRAHQVQEDSILI
jgi:hypothetical protein